MRIQTLMCLSLLTACQSSGAPEPGATASVEGAMRSWTEAFLSRDVPGMLSCYESSADTVLFHSTGAVVRGIDAISRDYTAVFGSTEFLAVDYKPIVVRRIGASVWMTGRLWMHTRQAGRDFVLELGTSFSMRWVDGAWRIVMEQSTPLEGVPRIREVRPGENPAPPKKAVQTTGTPSGDGG